MAFGTRTPRIQLVRLQDSVSLLLHWSCGGKKCQESNIGDSDNTGDGGKIVGRSIGACSGGIAILATTREEAVPEHNVVETYKNTTPRKPKDIWIAIKRLQHGKSLNKQDVKTNLFWEFGNLTSREEDSIESYYLRFCKMMNEMIKNKLEVATIQFNYQNEVNDIRAEKIARNANLLALIAATQQSPDTHYQAPKPHNTHAQSSKNTPSTRSHALTRNKGKEIAKPLTPPFKLAFKEDKNSDPEQAQTDNQKQLKKANATLTRELNECKSALKESNDIRGKPRNALHDQEIELEKNKKFKIVKLKKKRLLNFKAVCATCGKCVFNSIHDACVSKFINDMNAITKKPNVVPISTRKPKRIANQSVATHHKKIVASESTIHESMSYFRMLYENTSTVWFKNDQFAPILGYGDLVQGNFMIKRVAFKKSRCFNRDLQGNDLLTGNRGSNLYTISLQETSSPTLICFMLVPNGVPIAYTTDPSPQELELLFSPMYEEYFTAGNQSMSKSSTLFDNFQKQDTQTTLNVQPTLEPTTLSNVNAEETNTDQAADA
nr:hypothetical protein [Tanacetum cinerariifolium]